MPMINEILTKKQQMTVGILKKMKQLKELFLRIDGHLKSYLNYGNLRRLLHCLEQEREFIFYTDQLCSIAQYFGFFMIERKQRLLEDEEDQTLDFIDFTQSLESIQGSDLRLLNFLGLDTDSSILPEVIHAIENALQTKGVSSNKVATIDLNNEHLTSNSKVLSFISNQLSKINNHLISSGLNTTAQNSINNISSPYVSENFSKTNYDYMRPITPNSGREDNDSQENFSTHQDSHVHSFVSNTGRSKDLSDVLDLNDFNESISSPKKQIRSRSQSRGRSRSRQRSRNRSRSRSQIEINDNNSDISSKSETNIRRGYSDTSYNREDNSKNESLIKGKLKIIYILYQYIKKKKYHK